jgi:hypothetical protein
MSDPFDLAHNLAKSLAPFNHLVVAATDQAYLIGRLQGEVKEILFDLDEAIKQRDEISIHADAIIKEASALITRCVESRKASAYWNAVEQFRQFESRTT